MNKAKSNQQSNPSMVLVKVEKGIERLEMKRKKSENFFSLMLQLARS